MVFSLIEAQSGLKQQSDVEKLRNGNMAALRLATVGPKLESIPW